MDRLTVLTVDFAVTISCSLVSVCFSSTTSAHPWINVSENQQLNFISLQDFEPIFTSLVMIAFLLVNGQVYVKTNQSTLNFILWFTSWPVSASKTVSDSFRIHNLICICGGMYDTSTPCLQINCIQSVLSQLSGLLFLRL